jgi:hypothetical protein
MAVCPRRHIHTNLGPSPVLSSSINPYTRNWDVKLVRDTFWAGNADLILVFPIHQGRENILAWHFDKHGAFSVKSAYKVAREDRVGVQTTAANRRATTGNNRVCGNHSES